MIDLVKQETSKDSRKNLNNTKIDRLKKVIKKSKQKSLKSNLKNYILNLCLTKKCSSSKENVNYLIQHELHRFRQFNYLINHVLCKSSPNFSKVNNSKSYSKFNTIRLTTWKSIKIKEAKERLFGNQTKSESCLNNRTLSNTYPKLKKNFLNFFLIGQSKFSKNFSLISKRI